MSKLTIFVILVVVAALGVIWYFYFYSPAAIGPGEEAAAVQSEFEARLADLRRLKNLQIDTSVLRDEFFQSLAYPAISPSEVTPGRPNPFLPF